MKKRLLLSILTISFFSCGSANAQDIIHLKDSSIIKASINEVNQSTILFRKYGNRDLNVYSIPLSEVRSIEFKNNYLEKQGDHHIKVVKNEVEDSEDFGGIKMEYHSGKFSFVNADGVLIKNKIRPREMKSLLSNQVALDFYKGHRAFKTCAILAGSATVAFLGMYWAINWQNIKSGYYLDKKPMWIIIGIGLGTELSFGILSGVYGRKTVRSYNSYLERSRDRYSLNFGLTRNGIGLVLSF